MAETDAGGRIGMCPHNGCDFICCDFAAGNYIVLYPGELDEARQSGESTAHLDISEGHLGGHRAICRAKDTRTCDNGYKPLDCACYPFFPTIGADGEIEAGIKGAKCPLQVSQLSAHRSWAIRAWNRVAERVEAIIEWIRQTRLVGYERVIEPADQSEVLPHVDLVPLALLGDAYPDRNQR